MIEKYSELQLCQFASLTLSNIISNLQKMEKSYSTQVCINYFSGVLRDLDSFTMELEYKENNRKDETD